MKICLAQEKGTHFGTSSLTVASGHHLFHHELFRQASLVAVPFEGKGRVGLWIDEWKKLAMKKDLPIAVSRAQHVTSCWPMIVGCKMTILTLQKGLPELACDNMLVFRFGVEGKVIAFIMGAVRRVSISDCERGG